MSYSNPQIGYAAGTDIIPTPPGPSPSRSGAYFPSNPTVPLDTFYDSSIFINKSAAIQAAVNSAIATCAALECHAGRVYLLDTTYINLPPSSPLIIEGHGATWRSAYGQPCILYFNRTADGQTFNNVDVRDLIFDANNATSTVGQSVFGNVNFNIANGIQRVNFQHIYARRCQWINVHTAISGDGTAAVSCFNLECSQVFNDQPEAQNTILDIHVEQAFARGGNFGFIVNGTSSGGTAAVNVYLDRIFIDCDWDSTVVQSGTFVAGAGVQIGSLGFGDYCEVRMQIANSGDVGVEIDGMQTAHIWGRSTDARNANFFARNFNSPPDINSQRITFHGCEARQVNLPYTAGGGCVGYQIGGATGGTPTNPGFGEYVLENCKYTSYRPEIGTINGTALLGQQTLYNALTIIGEFTASYSVINDATGGARQIQLMPASPICRISGGDIRVIYAGTGGTGFLTAVCISPWSASGILILDLGHIRIASSLAGISASHTNGFTLGVVGAGGGVVRGRIRSIGWESFSGNDTTPKLFTALGTSVYTIDGRLIIDEIDLRKHPSASPQLIYSGGDTTNYPGTEIRSANYPTYPLASQPVGSANYTGSPNFTTVTFTSGTGNQYLGLLPAEIQFANGSGAGVTAIDVSKDGTTYENAWTQASGAMTQSVIVPIENGDFVRITFATTQPVCRVRYRRAQ